MKRTYQGNKRRRAKTHGFLARKHTVTKHQRASRVIAARRRKGRARLAL